MKSTNYHRTMMLQHWAGSVQSITWIMHQHTGSLSYIKPYLVSTVAFTLQQYCTAFKSHNVQDLKTVMTATRTVPTQDCLKKKVLIKEATNILQVVALHHLIRVISNVPLHTSASNIWLMLWLRTTKLRGKRNTSLAQVRGS